MIEVEAVITKLTTNKDGTQICLDVMPKSLDAINEMLNQAVLVKISLKQATLFDKKEKKGEGADE